MMTRKIRHKRSGVVLEGLFAECADCTRLPPYRYFAYGDTRYSKVDWEAVPEWVDVTGQCEFNEIDMTLRHGDEPFLGVLSKRCKDMRLRKVCRGELIPGDRAFIVERKT